MPTYDYTCPACGHRFERFEPINEAGSKECPSCGRRRARRLLGTGAGLIFKGSGFYVTDYKNPPPAGGEKKEKKAGAVKKEEPKK